MRRSLPDVTSITAVDPKTGIISRSGRGRSPRMYTTDQLNDAVISFVGKRRSASPSLNWNGDAGHFDEACRNAAESVVAYLDSIPTNWDVEEWDAAASRVRAALASAYPGLCSEALDALVWKFDYDWK
jgi:hypothetical protein